MMYGSKTWPMLKKTEMMLDSWRGQDSGEDRDDAG